MNDQDINYPAKIEHRSNMTISENERAWIGFIRLASDDTDPAPTLESVQQLRQIFAGPQTRNGVPGHE